MHGAEPPRHGTTETNECWVAVREVSCCSVYTLRSHDSSEICALILDKSSFYLFIFFFWKRNKGGGGAIISYESSILSENHVFLVQKVHNKRILDSSVQIANRQACPWNQ